MRKVTWYWKIWWWFGYHGIYQIGWLWRREKRLRDLRLREYVYILLWVLVGIELLAKIGSII